MTPQQFDEWIAFNNVEPFGDSWRQSATIAAEIYNTIAPLVAALSGEKVERLTPEHYIPGAKVDKPTRRLTNEEAQQASRRRAGV